MESDIAKNVINNIKQRRLFEENPGSYIKFFTQITFASRKLHYLNQDVLNYKIKTDKQVIELLKRSKEMFSTLKTAYLRQNFKMLEKLTHFQEEIIFDKGYRLLRKNLGDSAIALYQVLDVARNIYLATSPLRGTLIGGKK